MNNDTKYMNIALKEAYKAFKHKEIPVGAVIVKNDRIIAKAYNTKEKRHNSINHAEILCISKACKKLKNWRLEDCIMYVTMEPCMMCSGAIEQSRIKKVVYGANNETYGSTKQLKNVEVIPNICEQECKKIVQSFFEKLR